MIMKEGQEAGGWKLRNICIFGKLFQMFQEEQLGKLSIFFSKTKCLLRALVSYKYSGKRYL